MITPCRDVRVDAGPIDWKARAPHLRHRPIQFIPHPLFREPDAERRFSQRLPVAALRPAAATAKGVIETRLSPLYRAPLLPADAQRELFLRMNYAKFVAARSRERLRRSPENPLLIEEIEARLADADELRNRLVVSNLRLVASIAKRFADPLTRLEDLVSAGHLPLIRAVELFDVSRGHCFSTYASNAVRNHFLRLRARKARRAKQQIPGGPSLLESVADRRTPVGDWHELDRQRRRMAARLLGGLAPRERQILTARFGLSGGGARTFQEVGDLMGLSKERVRVITHKALERLQEAARDERLELPEM